MEEWRKKGVGSAIRWRGSNRGGVHIKKRERGEVAKKDVDPYIIRVGSSEEREKLESSEKDKLYLSKMVTSPLACVVSRERMPDREWVRSERRAENPRIRKEEDELRLNTWMQIRSTGWNE